jgi:hypothetical protein
MVLQENQGKVDLSRLMVDASEGSYQLTVSPIQTSADRRSRLKETKITLNWPPVATNDAIVGPIKSGLYELKLNGPTEKEFWLLIATPQHFGEQNASFQRAIDLTDTWNDRVKPESVHNFLRAYLSHLASMDAGTAR